MYEWVFVVGTFTATLSAARSWMMISIVSGATHMSSLLDIYAANAGAQTPRLSKRTAETHALASSARRVAVPLAVSIYRSWAGQDGDERRGSGSLAPRS